MSSTGVNTREQKEAYIRSLTLTNNQKRGFINSGLNRNTIQKVVNALRGRAERNTRINGILKALSKRPSNRGLSIISQVISPGWATDRTHRFGV